MDVQDAKDLNMVERVLQNKIMSIVAGFIIEQVWNKVEDLL